MELPKVEGTIQLRGKYHAKIRVPDAIQKHWDKRAVYQKSLKTSDPKTAEREVRRIRSMMDAQLEAAQAEESLTALKKHLPPDQRALLEKAGSIESLAKAFERGRDALAFMAAGRPEPLPELDYDYDGSSPPQAVVVAPFQDSEELEIERAAHDAAAAKIKAQANARGRVLRAAGQDIDLIDDVYSLRDVVEKWAPTVDPQTAETGRLAVRRFTELNGEVAVDALTRAHLRDYIEALRGLPKYSSGKVGGVFVRELPISDAVQWQRRTTGPPFQSTHSTNICL